MRSISTYLLFFLCGIVALSCKPKIEGPEISAGSIDPSGFVVIGTSSSQGYMNDALYYDGQVNSLANILSIQLSKTATIPFEQMLVGQTSVGINLKGQSRLILDYKTDCKGVTALSPVRLASGGDNSILASNAYNSTSPVRNLSIHNVRITDVATAGYGNSANGPGNYNPFYFRIASNPATSSILGDAIALNPTFFSVNLGENDLLDYALSGGTGSAITPSNGANGVGFDGSLDFILQQLTANGAKGVIANIPDFTDYPFFTLIPYNGLTLNEEQANTLNSIYVPMGTGISFQAGSNPFAIEDTTEPNNVRLIKEGELILLSVPLDSIKCNGMGSIVPIPDRYVLSLEEQEIIKTALTEYNTIIQNMSATYNIAFVNIHALFKHLKNGITYNGFNIGTEFVSGGVFSLDGKFPSAIGNALIANEYIKSINAKYDAKIPLCDPGDFTGVQFP